MTGAHRPGTRHKRLQPVEEYPLEPSQQRLRISHFRKGGASHRRMQLIARANAVTHLALPQRSSRPQPPKSRLIWAAPMGAPIFLFRLAYAKATPRVDPS